MQINMNVVNNYKKLQKVGKMDQNSREKGEGEEHKNINTFTFIL